MTMKISSFSPDEKLQAEAGGRMISINTINVVDGGTSRNGPTIR
jgi:hypothetical protein